MGGRGGRKKDDCWKQVIRLENGKVQCKYCGHEFVGGATRIKSHLSGNKNQGVEICTNYPLAINNSIKCEETRNLEDTTNLCSDYPIWGVASNYKKHKETMHSSEISEGMTHSVGPFSVLKKVDLFEALLVDYVFNSSLDQREIIFLSEHSHLMRSEFATLRPRSLLDSVLIDIFAEYLTDVERKKKITPSNWYLPLAFSTSALSGGVSSFLDFVKRQHMREKHMTHLQNCDKMFIPVHSCGHFYLYAVHLKNEKVEIWDSLPGFTHDKKITKKLLVALDQLFENDIRDNGRAFSNFDVAMAKDTPIQPNTYDCGIFVIKFMQQSADVMRHPSLMFQSDQERLDLALQLLKSDINKQRLVLISKVGKVAEAELLRQQNEIEGGHLSRIKRKDSNTSTRDFEDVQGAASTPFNDPSSSKRLKSNDSLCRCEKNSDSLKFPQGCTKVFPLPTIPHLEVEFFEDKEEQVFEWLEADEVSVIGVWGMGGVGKTTLATFVHNRLLERDDGLFDHVIWVTVSRDYSIPQMQRKIAKSIDVDIRGEIDEKRVAARLLHSFEQSMKTCVIILDDVWDPISLEQVGIPVSNNGIKVILTTRSLDVCQSMNCEDNIIQIMPNNGFVGWNLFEKTLVGDNGVLPSEIEMRANNVCEKCEGLPLAIVRVANSMKGKKEVREWRHLLENLKDVGNRHVDMKKWVYPVLTSSYDHLNDKKLQQCFLYCALVMDGFLSRENLIRYFVCEGFINGMKSLEAQNDEGHSILNNLKSRSLLEEDESLIGMNRLVRGMAISIAKENHGHMLIGHDQDWSEDVKKAFLLMDEDVQEIPSGTSPWCPKLSTLLLVNKDNLSLIADDFFINMPALKVLDLSNTAIKRLPTSISDLECLVALLLTRCKFLSEMPLLAKLQRLMWLDLSFTGVTQLPLRLGLAINLRRLDLRGTSQLKISTSSAIAELSNLQFLCLPPNPESVDVKAKDLEGLKKLEAVSVHFCDIKEYNDYVRSLRVRGRPLTSYLLILGTKPDLELHCEFPPSDSPLNKFPFDDNGNAIKSVKFLSVDLENSAALLPEDVDSLIIRECDQWRCLCDVLSFGEDYPPHPLNISYCEINECKELECLFCCLNSCPFCTSVRLVGELLVLDLDCLEVPCDGDTLKAPVPFLNPSEPLSDVTALHYRCNGITRLLSIPESFPAQLQRLKSIEVVDCNSMEEIFSVGKSEQVQGVSPHVDTILLPKLERVHLARLIMLDSVSKGITLAYDSLGHFTIENFQNLEGDPQIHSPFEITEWGNEIEDNY